MNLSRASARLARRASSTCLLHRPATPRKPQPVDSETLKHFVAAEIDGDVNICEIDIDIV
jgi:hypothetical protein